MIGTVVGAVAIVVLTACFPQNRVAFLDPARDQRGQDPVMGLFSDYAGLGYGIELLCIAPQRPK